MGKTELIKFISLGKYPTKLYHEGKGTHSSVVSGILTILLASAFLIVAISVLKFTFDAEYYIFNENLQKVKDQPEMISETSELLKSLFLFDVKIQIEIRNSTRTCDDLIVEAVL